jgi:muramoyltetrapeptide carboxypeptidase LdcA involved in peptidoglycan recycling
MTKDLRPPPKLQRGDRVAGLSPSWAVPAIFPAVHETAMRRLRVEIGVHPVEFPTTRMLDASPRDRARDLMNAFTDPAIKAVMATIGGEDQITVLPHLDPATMLENPKPYFGYSDNTNVLNWLWSYGLATAPTWGGNLEVLHWNPAAGRWIAPAPAYAGASCCWRRRRTCRRTERSSAC